MYCKNCEEYLRYDNDFCGGCGAKIIRNRLTVKGVFAEVKEEYLVSDNKLFLTFWHLLVKPEAVIQGYIDGRRKRYLNVIAYVALSLTVLGIYLFLLRNFFPDDPFAAEFNRNLLDGRKLADLTPEQQEKFLESSKKFSNFMNSFSDLLGLIIIITTPINALASYIIFITKRKHNYAEHIVLNYYMAAQTSILSSVISIGALPFVGNSVTTALIITLISLIYIGYVFKRIYGISVFESFYKTILFYILQTTIVFFLMIFLGGIGAGIYFWLFK
ncbi:DUF3667 domain-containing protein [Spongiivirga citrea]|uniref:DUF3667 domain-containing protein n=1 Tax=Spongiivirga citrea TaxID=1481457 RepID=A0A6M0CIW3_9FLAO|nr:DUF3667 domain-containing protein [Spongiivirga citrea]NER17888.1 DUF3667 domain-containing protein [Spongiivirga citrea]